MKPFAIALGAALLLSGVALAGNHEYRPAPGVDAGPAQGVNMGAPAGIPPECAAKTSRDDMKDCIKEKAQERGKARMMQGQGKR